MTEQLTYNGIRIRAKIGDWIGDLADILAIEGHHAETLRDLGFDDARLLADRLAGIVSVLGMLASTPNAYVNREALDEMQRQVFQAEEIMSLDWVGELLGRSEEFLGRKREPYYITF